MRAEGFERERCAAAQKSREDVDPLGRVVEAQPFEAGPRFIN